MIVNFRNAQLEELYSTGKSRKYKNVPADVVRKLPLAVEILQGLNVIQDIDSRNLKGAISIRCVLAEPGD